MRNWKGENMRHKKEWTDEEDQIVNLYFPNTKTSAIAKRLGRSEEAVRQRARLLFLYKEPTSYVVYKGDKRLFIGTPKEVMERFNYSHNTFRYYTSVHARRRNKGNRIFIESMGQSDDAYAFDMVK